MTNWVGERLGASSGKLLFMDFKLVSDYKPQGDQGRAIDALLRGVYDREQHQVLLGVTGSGKTYTMAKVIEAVNRPALVMAHNKTLAAQLLTSSRISFRVMRSSILFLTTTITSPKLTFRPPTFSLKRRRPSTMNSTSCGFRRPSRCLSGGTR